MDSRESLAQPQSLQQHQSHHHQQQHQQPPPGMMMPPNSYSIHHHLSNSPTTAAPSNNRNANMLSPNSMQQRFSLNTPDHQYGDGSSQSAGFRAAGYSSEPPRKKRGRPRKYSPSSDGNIALGLAPAPVTAVPSVAAPGNVESSNDGSGGTPNADSSAKKHRGRPPGSGKKQLDALGAQGVGFTPHVIIVKAGEDIASTIMQFSQQGPRTVCILSANGSICNVTLRQPATTSGTVTYEGRFEIISLSGSFFHSASNGNHNKPSGLSVSLAGSDGRVLGGGVAGMLVAASPVQVIVGSFITEEKKTKSSVAPSSAAAPNMLNFGGGGDGGGVPGISPPSEGESSESSDESGSSPLQRIPGSYNNASQQQQQQQQQHPHPHPHQHQPMQNMPMYSNMGWPSSTVNMLPN